VRSGALEVDAGQQPDEVRRRRLAAGRRELPVEIGVEHDLHRRG
jgi:hypothetical protein